MILFNFKSVFFCSASSGKKSLVYLFFIFSALTAKANDYFWVGGSGNWSDGNHWAKTSGGNVFYSQVPQNTDNVYFDSNSFTSAGQTVTLDITTPSCKDMNWTGVLNTPTFVGGSKTLYAYGSLTFVPGMTLAEGTLTVSFEGTSIGNTLTTAGKSLTGITINGIGGGLILQDNLTLTGSVVINNGSFDTNGKTIDASQFYSGGSNTKSLALGSSIINLSDGNVPWDFRGVTNMTLTGGTSTINLISTASPKFAGAGLTYYDLNFTSSSASLNWLLDPARLHNISSKGASFTLTGITTINGDLTCNGTGTFTASVNNTFSGTTTIFSKTVLLSGNNIFGTLNLNGSAGTTYTFGSGKTQTINNAFNIVNPTTGIINIMNASTAGTQATISMSTGRLCIDYLSVKDIKAVGGATFTAGSGSQNLSNNTGITFIPASTMTGPTVSITLSQVATSLVYGNEVVFTATNTNNVASTLFNWFVNNISVQNSTSNTFRTSTLLNGSMIKCTISEPYIDVNYPTACDFYLNGLSNSINVVVTPAPTFTAQPVAAVCVGVNVTYTTQTSQSNYVWTLPGSLNTDYSITSGGVGSTNNTVTLKWLTVGSKTVTINYSNSSGSSASSAVSSTAITVNDLPTITGFVAVKVGNTITLTGNGTPATNNAWRSSNANVTIGNNGVVSGVTVGTSVITYTNSGGCQQIITITVESASLPVNLISFTAKAQNNIVLLNWITLSEQNNSHFRLSHSIDGNNFNSMTSVQASANGNTKNTYSFAHTSPTKGVNYYKLEQIDLDGTVKDLGVKAVNFSLSNSQKVVVYPNPTQNEVKVSFDKDFYTLAKLIDMQGKVLLKKSIAINDSELSYDLRTLKSGTYLIQLEGKTTYIQKVVKD